MGRKKAARARLCRDVSSLRDLEEALGEAKLAGLTVDRYDVMKLCRQEYIVSIWQAYASSMLAPVTLLLSIALIVFLRRRWSACAGNFKPDSACDAPDHEVDVKPEDSASQIHAVDRSDIAAIGPSTSTGSSSNHWSLLSSSGEKD